MEGGKDMTKGKNQHPSRAEQAVEFTEEFLKNLPVARHSWDFKYDKAFPAMAVRKLHADKPHTFHVITSTIQRRACKMIYNWDVGAYVTIGHMPVEAARMRAREMVAMYDGAVARYKMDQRSGGPTTNVVPEQILAEKPGVEEPSYQSLLDILMDAYAQAAHGKGAHRHGNGLNFEDQDMLAIMDRVGEGFGLGQAIKKLCEGRRLPYSARRAEYLGAMVYIAGTILWGDLKGDESKETVTKDNTR